MSTLFEDTINSMLNVSFGAAAVATEKGRGFLEELASKGAEARKDPATPDFARSLADAFAAAGGTVSEVTERLADGSASMGDKVLDELVLMRVRSMNADERSEFVAHIEELVAHADDEPVKVKVESVEVDVECETEQAEAQKPAE